MGLGCWGCALKTIDISGMGGSYEAGCQLMLLRGLKYLEEHPDFDFSVYKVFKGFYGICEGEGESARELDAVISRGIEPSGAMHQAVISHLAYIHKKGYDAWIAEAGKGGARVYEMPSEEELENEILTAQIEWQLKIDRGYDPMAELFKEFPLKDVITVDSNDPDSIRKAAEEIARRMRGGRPDG